MKKKSIRLRQSKKLLKFRKSQQTCNKSTTRTEPFRDILYHFPSYALSYKELNVLQYGLDHHIPTKAYENVFSTEFENFFKNLLKDNILRNETAQVMTKLTNSCEKYCTVKVSKYPKNVINNLIERNDIAIMKQDKGIGVVIMDKSIYTEKGLALLSTKRFQKLNLDPTESLKGNVQRMVKKMKSKLTI